MKENYENLNEKNGETELSQTSKSYRVHYNTWQNLDNLFVKIFFYQCFTNETKRYSWCAGSCPLLLLLPGVHVYSHGTWAVVGMLTHLKILLYTTNLKLPNSKLVFELLL